MKKFGLCLTAAFSLSYPAQAASLKVNIPGEATVLTVVTAASEQTIGPDSYQWIADYENGPTVYSEFVFTIPDSAITDPWRPLRNYKVAVCLSGLYSGWMQMQAGETILNLSPSDFINRTPSAIPGDPTSEIVTLAGTVDVLGNKLLLGGGIGNGAPGTWWTLQNGALESHLTSAYGSKWEWKVPSEHGLVAPTGVPYAVMQLDAGGTLLLTSRWGEGTLMLSPADGRIEWNGQQFARTSELTAALQNYASKNFVTAGYLPINPGKLTVGVGATAYSAASALGDRAVAHGDSALAAGSDAHAMGRSSVALGTGAEALQAENIAIGRGAKANANSGAGTWYITNKPVEAVAIGGDSEALADASAAFGQFARAYAPFSLALGPGARSSGQSSISMGYEAHADLESAMSLGQASGAWAASSMAVGIGAHATAANSSAIGFHAASNGQAAIAVGKYALAQSDESSAFGHQARAYHWQSTAIGHSSSAESHSSTALGAFSTAVGGRSIAIGAGSQARGQESAAIGLHSRADGYGQVVVGVLNDPSVYTSPTPGDLDSAVFVVGNGHEEAPGQNIRSNAIVVKRSGETTINGPLNVTGVIRVPPAGDLSMGDFDKEN